MKGLKIIPMFLVLIILSYVGMLFVEANRDEVAIHFGSYISPPMALGFVVLTSVLLGMVFAGLLCIVELGALYLQNKGLRRKLSAFDHAKKATGEPSDIAHTRHA